MEQKQNRRKGGEKAESARQKQLQHELEWIRMSPRARQAKGKARLTAYEQLLASAPEHRQGPGEIYIPPGPKLGGLAVEAKQVRKGYGDRLLIEDLTFKLPPGGIVGVIGPNGAGNTTLFRMIAAQDKPDMRDRRAEETLTLPSVHQRP